MGGSGLLRWFLQRASAVCFHCSLGVWLVGVMLCFGFVCLDCFKQGPLRLRFIPRDASTARCEALPQSISASCFIEQELKARHRGRYLMKQRHKNTFTLHPYYAAEGGRGKGATRRKSGRGPSPRPRARSPEWGRRARAEPGGDETGSPKAPGDTGNRLEGKQSKAWAHSWSKHLFRACTTAGGAKALEELVPEGMEFTAELWGEWVSEWVSLLEKSPQKQILAECCWQVPGSRFQNWLVYMESLLEWQDTVRSSKVFLFFCFVLFCFSAEGVCILLGFEK